MRLVSEGATRLIRRLAWRSGRRRGPTGREPKTPRSGPANASSKEFETTPSNPFRHLRLANLEVQFFRHACVVEKVSPCTAGGSRLLRSRSSTFLGASLRLVSSVPLHIRTG